MVAATCWHNRDGKRIDDVTDAAGLRDVDAPGGPSLSISITTAISICFLVAEGSLACRNNLTARSRCSPTGRIAQGGTDARVSPMSTTTAAPTSFVTGATGSDGLFH